MQTGEHTIMQTRSPRFECSLPVTHGQIVDADGVLAALRAECVTRNARIPRGHQVHRQRWVIDLHYRGPRHGNRYRTPRWAATHVDVYLRLRSL
jgi:hypothetical protein